MAIDIEALLSPVPRDPPCGPAMEYDREFVELERAAQGRPERQMGNNVTPAEEPDWKLVGQKAVALLGRTKDLRVAAHLAKGLLRTGGLVGFADGVRLVRGLLERYWDTVHPRLDPDDDDSTMRVNSLAAVSDEATLNALRVAPLVDGPGAGRFSLRDLIAATGEYALPAGQSAPDIASIEAAFDAAPAPVLRATAAVLEGARDDLAAVEALVTDKVGSAQGINLGKLSGMLGQASKHLASRLERRSPAPDEAIGEEAPAVAADAPQRAGGGVGQIRSRDDVIRALDLVCAYYQRAEPSSPVPLLLTRAKRLATMTFVDIVKDMVPDALSRIQVIGGADVEGSS
jgi:type VI secretion system protein ImpA